MSAERGAPLAIKKLLEEWLIDTLTNILNKPTPGSTVKTEKTVTIPKTDE